MSLALSQPDSRREPNSWLVFAVMAALSLGVHAATLMSLPSDTRPMWVVNKPVEVEMIVKEKPPPPPPPEEKKKEPPKPPPVKVAAPPPKIEAPPPPNQPPPPDQPAKPVPLVVGVTLSSTTAAGGFAAGVGNTLYGKTADKATDAADVKAYAAPKYVPPGAADTDPVLDREVKIPYPEEAKKAGIEGTVRLKITVDSTGAVTEAMVISGPGYGLNEAALAAVRKFHFKPAIKGGESVGTTLVYNYTFELD
jgi:protein TonB